MSDPNIYKEYAATPGETLEQYIMDPCGSKTEHEWWASREITRLRAENEKLRKLVKDAYYEAYRDRDGLGDAGTDDPEDRCAWRLSAAAAAIKESVDE